jgi:hypothetical protein
MRVWTLVWGLVGGVLGLLIPYPLLAIAALGARRRGGSGGQWG